MLSLSILPPIACAVSLFLGCQDSPIRGYAFPHGGAKIDRPGEQERRTRAVEPLRDSYILKLAPGSSATLQLGGGVSRWAIRGPGTFKIQGGQVFALSPDSTLQPLSGVSQSGAKYLTHRDKQSHLTLKNVRTAGAVLRGNIVLGPAGNHETTRCLLHWSGLTPGLNYTVQIVDEATGSIVFSRNLPPSEREMEIDAKGADAGHLYRLQIVPTGTPQTAICARPFRVLTKDELAQIEEERKALAEISDSFEREATWMRLMIEDELYDQALVSVSNLAKLAPEEADSINEFRDAIESSAFDAPKQP